MNLPRSTSVVAALGLTASLVGTAVAAHADDSTLEPHHTFTMSIDAATGAVAVPNGGAEIPNIDSVKSTIRKYYNTASGTIDWDGDGTPDVSGQLANPTSSPYLSEVSDIEQDLLGSLRSTARPGQMVVFDADDTTLWNYNFEDAYLNFNFDPVKQTTWVDGKHFPAVPGMADTVNEILDRGYAVYLITGRTANQEDATIANLTEQGYVDGDGNPIFDNDNVFTKWNSGDPAPAYIAQCTGARCTTVEYKAQTRAHIEDMTGGTIIANVGDQWSDLWGGYAERSIKLPNPTYFLASPDLVGAPARDASMVPPSTYTMLPDGSSGLTERGDGIPNIDLVRNEIRAYYAAGPGTLPDGTAVSNGIANKDSSPYISEMNGLASSWTDELTTSCTDGVQAHDTAAAALAAANQDLHAAKRQLRDDKVALDAARDALHRARHKLAAAKDRLAAADTPREKRKARKAVHHWRTVVAERKDLVRAAEETVWADREAVQAAQAVVDGITVPGLPAAVFDADDTTLWTYDMEDGDMKFVFNPTRQADWVNNKWFPAVPGMVDLVKAADTAGCEIFGLTGRGTAQQDATIANLTERGYVDGAGDPLFTSDDYFTKPAFSDLPPYLDCTVDGNPTSCSTIEYKSQTRAHIENDLGFDVVGNFGDQFSDLKGGSADVSYKLPNPTYYLP
ncbi:HAD family acid phosphatase [Nocardioides sp. MH1]|uniref:HAD family acid phosphatase n=1 Tax=Nocardioides sp. MH1 TaxID=3242490 RepID=UPI0035204CC8